MRWSDIAAIGRARVMNLTILMPVIGYLIIFNDDLISYLRLSGLFTECHQDSAACQQIAAGSVVSSSAETRCRR